MSVPLVTLILDEGDASGALLSRGWANIEPTARIPVTGALIVGQAPVQASFNGVSAPGVQLVPNDSEGPVQGNGTPGWDYTISYGNTPGAPASWSFLLAAGPASFTATNASPCVFTWTATPALTSLPNGTGISLAGGSLPAGFTAGTTYYVVASSGSTFELAATAGGTPIASTSSGSGTLSVTQWRLSALATMPVAAPGSIAVTSVFGRAGAVTAQSGDYSVSQVTGAAPLNSPAFTGTPTAPTAAPGTNTTQVATTAFVRAQAVTVNGLNYGADPTGTRDSTAAIQAALLSFGTLGGWNGTTSGIVDLPYGDYVTSKPLIIPSAVELRGAGWGTVLDLATGSNCDVIQFATYNSASQAAILGVPANSIANAFWAGVTNLQIHGDAFHTTVPGYHHGINITTSPLNSTAPGDPDFDPHQLVRDVWIKACTGDGINHQGRSGALFERVWSAYHNGNGITHSYDTTMLNVLTEGTNCGIYTNHSSVTAAGCKSYNTKDWTWVSGTSYSPGQVAVSAGVMYFCIAAVTGSTAPASDPAHWTAVSATSPQATGYGVYWDTNAGEQNWSALSGEQNSKGDFYFHGPLSGAITIMGSSSAVNFNNGQAAFNALNPNHYASVTFDGCHGVTAIIDSSTQVNHAVLCTVLNSASGNTLIASTDGTEATQFSGSFSGFSVVNGTAVTGAGGMPVVASTGLSGFALTNGTPTIVSWTTPNDGNMHVIQIFTVLNVTSGETGGEIDLHCPLPDGTNNSYLLYAENLSANQYNGPVFALPVGPGKTVSIGQGSALLGGTAKLWAEIWGA